MKPPAYFALCSLLSLVATGCSSNPERFSVEPGYYSPIYSGEVSDSISIDCDLHFEPISFHQEWAPSVRIVISNKPLEDEEEGEQLIALSAFRNPDDDRNHFRIQTVGMDRDRNSVRRGTTGGDEVATIGLTWHQVGQITYRFEDQESSFLMVGRGPFVPKFWFVTASGSAGTARCGTSEI